MYVYACICRVCQINRLKMETVGRTGQDFGLFVCTYVFAYESLTENEVETGEQAVCVYMSVEVSFFMLRLWARLDAATGSNTG